MGLTKQCGSTSTTNYLALKSQIRPYAEDWSLRRMWFSPVILRKQTLSYTICIKMGRRWQEQFWFLAINIHDTHAIWKKKKKRKKNYDTIGMFWQPWNDCTYKGLLIDLDRVCCAPNSYLRILKCTRNNSNAQHLQSFTSPKYCTKIN